MNELANRIINNTVTNFGDRFAEINKILCEKHEGNSNDIIQYLEEITSEIGFKSNRLVSSPNELVTSVGNGKPHIALFSYFTDSGVERSNYNFSLMTTCAYGVAVAAHEAIRLLKYEGKLSLVFVRYRSSNESPYKQLRNFFLEINVAFMINPGGGTRNILSLSGNAYKELNIRLKNKRKSTFSSRCVFDAAAHIHSKMAFARSEALSKSSHPACGIMTHRGRQTYKKPNEIELFYTLRGPTFVKVQEMEKQLKSYIKEAEIAYHCTSTFTITSESSRDRQSFAISKVYLEVAADKEVSFETEIISCDRPMTIPFDVPSLIAIYENCSSVEPKYIQRRGKPDYSTHPLYHSLRQIEILAETIYRVVAECDLFFDIKKTPPVPMSKRKRSASTGDRRSNDEFSLNSSAFFV